MRRIAIRPARRVPQVMQGLVIGLAAALLAWLAIAMLVFAIA